MLKDNLEIRGYGNMSTYGYLQHHGILGQKWGVRRYQNPDGSLTPEGRERYGYSSNNTPKQNYENIKRGFKDKIFSTGDITNFYKDDENIKETVSNLYKEKQEAKWDEYNLKKEALFKDDAHAFFNATKNTEDICKRVEEIVKDVEDTEYLYFDTVWQATKYALSEEILKDPEVKKWVDKSYNSQKKYNDDLINYAKNIVDNIESHPIEFGLKGNLMFATKQDLEKLMPKRLEDLTFGEYEYIGNQDNKVSYLGNIIDNEMISHLPNQKSEYSYLDDKSAKIVEDKINDLYWKTEDYLKDKGYYIYD